MYRITLAFAAKHPAKAMPRVGGCDRDLTATLRHPAGRAVSPFAAAVLIGWWCK